ncbi:MAG: hypothetical protein CO042_02625 [Parcubacteria group bacterium CG_4_9_14_0_2_um_filter_41_8]|nr:MAG: hypothetical protein AUJ34_01120 [Parcubacteria group bacterium CG1_02_41_12]PIQ80324.1 MAG: hypothetical protein COV79_01065 [Parcubacteria group bacterium CG11_big_fil_rev_8_21_14_0_20_41_14]PJC40661.1 MAG: hypothetical protein CO042_02625 [Parcubacteria group bacterium CG_4_9_14_0_2_um_filter_41_8]
MNTQYKQKNRFDDRFAKIATMGQIIFHAKDLANLWRIGNDNTLYATLSRYVKKGLLFRAHKGLYAIKPIDQIDPIMLGIKALRRFAYASTETALARSGIIQQEMHEITLVSDISKRFSIGSHRYRCRKLNDQYLHNIIGIIAKNGYKIATMPRAIADMLYFNKNAHFDAKNSIDWKQVKIIQKQVYDSSK